MLALEHVNHALCFCVAQGLLLLPAALPDELLDTLCFACVSQVVTPPTPVSGKCQEPYVAQGVSWLPAALQDGRLASAQALLVETMSAPLSASRRLKQALQPRADHVKMQTGMAGTPFGAGHVVAATGAAGRSSWRVRRCRRPSTARRIAHVPPERTLRQQALHAFADCMET